MSAIASAHTEPPPLSAKLSEMLADDSLQEGITIDRLLTHTQGKSLYLVFIVLCLPFVMPISVPGLSTLIGSIITVLCIRVVFGKQARLPRRLGERTLPPYLAQRVLGGSLSVLRLVEKFVRPRRSYWMAWRTTYLLNSALLVILALLLALPLPSPPFFFSNSIPSYGIIVLAASMMEEDGNLVWFGYALFALNLLFFGLMGGVVVEVLWRFGHAIKTFLLGS